MKKQIAEAIKIQAPAMVNRTFQPYNGNATVNTVRDSIVKDALNEYAKELEGVFKEYAKSLLNPQNIDKTIKDIIADNIYRGVISGLHEYHNELDMKLNSNESSIIELKCKLGI